MSTRSETAGLAGRGRVSDRRGRRDLRRQLWPSRQCPDPAKVVVRRRVYSHAHRDDAFEHHDRVVRAAAETLRPRQQVHQRRIVLRTELDSAPGEVMKDLEVLPARRGECKLTALGDRPAIRFRRRILAGSADKQEQKESRCVEKGHVGSVSSAGNRLGRMLACPAMSSARFPHPLTLLTACILVAADLQLHPPGRSVRPPRRSGNRPAGRAWQAPITASSSGPSVPFEALVAIPKGLADAGVGCFSRLPGRRRFHRRRRDRCAATGGRVAGAAAAESRSAGHSDRLADVRRRRRAREHVGGDHRARAGAAARHAPARVRRRDRGRDQRRRGRASARRSARSIRSRCRSRRSSPGCRCSRVPAVPHRACSPLALAIWICGDVAARDAHAACHRRPHDVAEPGSARCAPRHRAACSCSRPSRSSSTA